MARETLCKYNRRERDPEGECIRSVRGTNTTLSANEFYEILEFHDPFVCPLSMTPATTVTAATTTTTTTTTITAAAAAITTTTTTQTAVVSVMLIVTMNN